MVKPPWSRVDEEEQGFPPIFMETFLRNFIWKPVLVTTSFSAA
jgi:hypothetical protein